MLADTGGETPTVTIVWGDEDRGTDYADLDIWDNKVTLGLIGSGTFSTNLTGLQLGKVYYARTAAANGAGEIVSTSMAVLTPSFKPLASISPSNYAGLQIWFDANDSSTLWQDAGGTSPAGPGTAVERWDDKSGNGHTATRTAGTLSLVGNQINGMSVVHFADNTYANVTGNMYSKQQYFVFNLSERRRLGQCSG